MRSRAIRRDGEQPGRRRGAAPSKIAAMSPVYRRKTNPSLQCTVEQRMPVRTERGGRFEHGERQIGDPQAAHRDLIRITQVTAAYGHAGPPAGIAATRHSQLHRVRQSRIKVVPPRGAYPVHHRVLTGPQRGGAQPHLVGVRMISGQVDPRMQPLPPPIGGASLDRVLVQAGIPGLLTADHPSLPTQVPVQFHSAQMRLSRPQFPMIDVWEDLAALSAVRSSETSIMKCAATVNRGGRELDSR